MHYLAWNTIVTKTKHAEIFATETSDRAFEEEVMLAGFAAAPSKTRRCRELCLIKQMKLFTARYSHETIALAFSITEEANSKNNLYDRLAARYTKALARIYVTH